MPSDPVKAFPFLFYLQITSRTETRKERSSQTLKGRKREREKEWLIDAAEWQREREKEERVGRVSSDPTPDAAARSCCRVLNSRRRSLSFLISLSLLNRVWSSQHRADRDCSTAPRDLAFASAARSRLSSNPVTSLSSFFSQFDRIWWIFFLGFVCVSVLRNDIIYLFGSWENVSNK